MYISIVLYPATIASLASYVPFITRRSGTRKGVYYTLAGPKTSSETKSEPGLAELYLIVTYFVTPSAILVLPY